MLISPMIFVFTGLLVSCPITSITVASVNKQGLRWGWNHQLAQTRSDEKEAAPPWEGPQPDEPPSTPGPIFEVTSANIVVRPGRDVMLPCRVRNLGDKVVSWIRSKDLHILSSHVFIFTTDSRFSVSHPEGDSVSWDLRLKGARPADQGLYECQVNTEPKIKQAVMLTVSEMELGDSPYFSYTEDQNNNRSMARILGPREQIVREGSTVTLSCEVRTKVKVDPPPPVHHHAKPTRLVDWLFEGQLLTFQATRGGISVETERTGLQVWSRLTVADININDMGRYTCKPLQAPPAVVTLIVVEGETMEAMRGHQADHHSSTSSTLSLSSIPLILVVAYQIIQY